MSGRTRSSDSASPEHVDDAPSATLEITPGHPADGYAEHHSPVELAADHPLRLFLGSEPAFELSWPVQAAVRLDDGSAGSILIVANGSVRAERPIAAFLADCSRALRAGGRIAVLFPNTWHPLVSGPFAWLRRRREQGARSVSGIGRAATFGVPTLRSVVDALHAGGYVDVAVHAAAPVSGCPDEIRPRTWRDAWAAPAWLVTAGRLATDPPQDRMQRSAGHGAPDAAAPPGANVDSMLLDAIVAATNRSCEGPRPPGRWLRVTNSSRGKSLALVAANDAGIVIRLPRWPVARQDEAEAHRTLRGLQANRPISARVPRPLCEGTIGGQTFFAESRLPGVSLGAALSRDATRIGRRHWLEQAETFLRAMNPELDKQPATALNDGEAGAEIRAMLERVLSHVADAGLREATRSMFEASTMGATSRIGIVHGDFGCGNILVSDGAITGVIDWEASRRTAPPVLDAFNYVDSVGRSCDARLSIVETIPMLAEGEWPIVEELDFLHRFLDYCGIDRRHHRGFALLFFLFHVGPQLRFAASEEGPKRRLQQVLRRLLHRA